ncbi:hypothetical protein [Planctellipticum variicoloris]|uniref:hypothetical protein n=1 Tax=Planctellipticum variicoloris TaxID=3064265 RepID=UPI003013EAC5|nr:hypothetical protein SH412_001978 [Planctomycetaceae bacterium SH412]
MTETLVDIVKGVIAARYVIEESGGRVASKTKNTLQFPREVSGSLTSKAEALGISESVAFDLAVTTRSESTSNKSGQVQVWVLQAGGGEDSSIMGEQVSRIRFSVPLTFPPSQADH